MIEAPFRVTGTRLPLARLPLMHAGRTLSVDLQAAVAHRYVVDRELGRGGHAVVHLAFDRLEGRWVALKVLTSQLAVVLHTQRFLREIAIVRTLEHHCIVPLLDSGEADGFLYYAMPYVPGLSVRQRLEHDRRIPLAEAVRITRDVAGALAYAHALDVVHRDIKPENIVCDANHAVVLDFGIARGITLGRIPWVTREGMTVGTPGYMSPEQGAGWELDGRSDVYSLGCVLFEMLAGHPPYVGATPQDLLTRHALDPVPRLGDVPASVRDAVAKAMAKKPAHRFATAAEFAGALPRVL